MRFIVWLSIMSIGVASYQTFAQPEIQWQWSGIIAGRGGFHGPQVCRTERSDYVIAGTQDRSIGISLVNSEGKTVWQKRYSTYDSMIQQTSTSSVEGVNSLQVLNDGGFALAGVRSSMWSTGDRDAWVLRLDSLGALVWKKTFGLPFLNDPADVVGPCEAWCLREALNGDLVLSGDSSNTPWMCRLDRQGNTLWTNRYGENGSMRSFEELTTGRMVGFCYRILGLDSNGVSLFWSDYATGSYSLPQAVQFSRNGDIVALRGTWMPNVKPKPRFSYVLTCVNTNGVTIWERAYGDSVTSNGLKSFAEMPDSGFVLAGVRFDSLTPHPWLIRTNAHGDTLWTRILPAIGRANSVVSTPDGGVVVAVSLEDSGDVNRADLIKFSEKPGASIKHPGHIPQQSPALRVPAHSAHEGAQLFDLRGRPAGRFTASPVTGNRPTQCAGIYILRKGQNKFGRCVVDSRN